MESEDSGQSFLRELEQKVSTCPPLEFDLQGFATEQEAQAVANEIASYLRLFGKFFNLKRLSRVIVASDYTGALANLERGIETREILAPTQDDVAIGIAMTPSVIVSGEPASVMVLHAAHMNVLLHAERPDMKDHFHRVVHALAHECGHVHDLDVQTRAFPDTFLKTTLNYKDGTLLRIASACWDEYIASRLSAFMGNELTTKELEDTLCIAIETTKAKADNAIRQYRMHADLDQIAREVTADYKRVLVYASYLIGHIDGLEGSFQELAARAIQTVEDNPYFKPFFVRLQAELTSMYQKYGSWETIDVFAPLKCLAEDLLKSGGFHIEQDSLGVRITIPFSPETTPSMKEMLEFRRTRVERKSNV